MIEHKNIVSWSRTIYKQPTQTRDLMEWVISNEHADLVGKYRNGKLQKQALPVILPAGVFEHGKSVRDFAESSGILYIDIDGKSNNIKRIRQRIDAPWIKAVTVSSGGNGLSVFIPVDAQLITTDPYPHKVYGFMYKQAEALFKQSGIITDPACKNINRLRYASVDDKPYINYEATKFPFIEQLEREELKKPIKATTELKREILEMVDYIDKYKLDISAKYNDWLYIAGLFNNVFGMNQGLELYLRISKHYKGFSEEEAENKYVSCLSFKNSTPGRFFILVAPKIKFSKLKRNM
jgi:hypothetical protein